MIRIGRISSHQSMIAHCGPQFSVATTSSPQIQPSSNVLKIQSPCFLNKIRLHMDKLKFL